jgi:hypothetical protein
MNSDQNRIARLESIQDEVEQLHPLLRHLLPQIPNVKEMEYTHGQNEMGADFIFSRTEDVFNDVEYVGVIAKIGKISQDYSDIERQIRECELERLFCNGKKKIYLTEIWIISTGVISHNAQIKINNEYKTRRIRFIDRERLSSLIDKHLPNYWTDVSLEIGDYLHRLATENDKIDRSLSLVQSSKDRFYIDQDVFEARTFDRNRHKPAPAVDIHKEISIRTVLLVEGEMGSGKSKLLRHLIDYYAHPRSFLATKLIPIPISFHDYVDRYSCDPELVARALLPEGVRNLKPVGAVYLFLLDGADEKNATSDDLSTIITKVAQSIAEHGSKAVITSRWAECFDRDRSFRSAVCRLELHQLSMSRLFDFIRRLCKDTDCQTRLLEDLKRSSIFRELPKSPIAAILLAKLINENSKELPSNLTELYSKYTELSLGRWDIEKGLGTLSEYEARSSIIMEIATHFMQNSLESIAISEAKEHFIKYLSERNLDLNPTELFNQFIGRCDIIALDKQKGTFSFKHKTFVEYFYAKSYTRKTIIIDERVWSPYWSTAFFFYIGLQRDCPEAIRAITSVSAKNEEARWMRLINTPNFLLAGFASPYNLIEEVLERAILDAVDLYSDVAYNKIDSLFHQLTKMHFLWLMQMMIRKGFGYKFFKKAVEGAAIKICDECPDRKRAALAVFFLAEVQRELGERDTFDFLIEKFRKDLSIELELGIGHETLEDQQKSVLIKKLDRRVHRAVQTDPKLREFVDALYENPISKHKKEQAQCPHR